MKETRSNEDENLFFQRLEKEKIGGPLKGKMKLLSIMLIEWLYINIKKKLLSQAIMKEHKQASPATAPVTTRGALKRKCVQQNFPSSKKTKMVGTKFSFVFPY